MRYDPMSVGGKTFINQFNVRKTFHHTTTTAHTKKGTLFPIDVYGFGNKR